MTDNDNMDKNINNGSLPEASGGFSLFSSSSEGENSLTFVSTRGEELPFILTPVELGEYSSKFGYPLTEFESRDIAESIAETAEFYDLFVTPEMIEDSIRMCSILKINDDLYKGGGVDYSMIEQFAMLEARVHDVIDLYMPLLDEEIKVFLGFSKCEDFDDEYNDMLLNIITDMLEENACSYGEHSVYEAAYLFFTALKLRYKDDIEEYLEYRERKVAPGRSLSAVADRVFEMYSNMCGGVID